MAPVAAVLETAARRHGHRRGRIRRALRLRVRPGRHPGRERRRAPGSHRLLLGGWQPDGDRGCRQPAERDPRPGARPGGTRRDRRREREFLLRFRGLALRYRAGRGEHGPGPGRAGRLHHHPAVCEEHVPLAGPDAQAQGEGVLHRAEAGQPQVQVGDTPGVPQHQLFRAAFVRYPGRRERVLRHSGQGPGPQPGCGAGRAAQRGRAVRSGAERGQPPACGGAVEVDSGPRGGNRSDEPGGARPVHTVPRAAQTCHPDQSEGPDRLSRRRREEVSQEPYRPDRPRSRTRRLPHSHHLREGQGDAADESGGGRAAPQYRPEEAGRRRARGIRCRVGTAQGRRARRALRRSGRHTALREQRGHRGRTGRLGLQAFRDGRRAPRHRAREGRRRAR